VTARAVAEPARSRGAPPPGDAADAPLRIALLAGTLGQGGAEKQLVFIARALRDAGAALRVYSLTRGEWYERVLDAQGLAPTWVGERASTPARLVRLTRAVRAFRPHVVQAGHFFTNLYVAGAAAAAGAASIGSIREDPRYGLAQNGRWGRPLLRAPSALIANSEAARGQAIALGALPSAIHVLPNVLDVREFDAAARAHAPDDDGRRGDGRPLAVAVGSLVPVKRFDRFLDALAHARRTVPALTGAIVGDGPERAALEARAGALGLLPHGVRFLGRRADVPALLRAADVLVLTSDTEGFPNVVLEGMAAGLPVITTPAGDAPVAVRDGETGHVVAFDDPDALAARLAELAASPALRATLGGAGRARVEAVYAAEGLAGRLLDIYRHVADARRDRRLAAAVEQVRR
jgi:glycosyltransferase involved in cell wall biosynthesis